MIKKCVICGGDFEALRATKKCPEHRQKQRAPKNNRPGKHSIEYIEGSPVERIIYLRKVLAERRERQHQNASKKYLQKSAALLALKELGIEL